jgi:hypothetical protein
MTNDGNPNDERMNYGQENFRSQVSNFNENGCGPVLPGFARFFIWGAPQGGSSKLSSTNVQKNAKNQDTICFLLAAAMAVKREDGGWRIACRSSACARLCPGGGPPRGGRIDDRKNLLRIANKWRECHAVSVKVPSRQRGVAMRSFANPGTQKASRKNPSWR